jgi:hypothetical protein
VALLELLLQLIELVWGEAGPTSPELHQSEITFQFDGTCDLKEYIHINVHFHTKNADFWYILDGLGMKNFGYFIAILDYFFVILYFSCCHVGIFFTIHTGLLYQVKSGNCGTYVCMYAYTFIYCTHSKRNVSINIHFSFHLLCM